MKYKEYYFLGLCLCLILLLSGCASYKVRPLKHLTTINNSKDNKVKWDYYIFNRSDCKRYLGHDLIKHGFQPIHFTITNNLDRPIHFSSKRIEHLSIVLPNEVAQKVHTNTTGRVVSYSVGALFIWPLTWPLAIPAIVDGIGSCKANKNLDEDYENKFLYDQIVNPYSSINGLLFIDMGSYNPNFKIKLWDLEEKKTITLKSF